jgi:prepilin-type processing-associated H-X9-DG protein
LNVVRATYTLAINTVSTSTPVTQGAVLVAGDAFDVESLPLVPAIDLTVPGPLATVGALYPRRQCTVSHIDCPNVRVNSSGSALRGLAYLFGCRVSIAFFNGLYGQVQFAATPIMGCSYYCTDFSFTQLYVFHGGVNCLFGDGHVQTLLQNSMLHRQCLWQGTNVSSRVYQEGDDNQIFDVADAGSTAFVCQFMFWKNTSGDGNVGYGATLSNNANYRATFTWNVKGALADVQLTAAPAINLTVVQFRQPNDYAQKGTTGAMVAGTITVTVPWYDNAVQKVTVSHAVFAGTPGILSVQQISTTQFTITSSSAIDTSTVNWQNPTQITVSPTLPPYGVPAFNVASIRPPLYHVKLLVVVTL